MAIYYKFGPLPGKINKSYQVVGNYGLHVKMRVIVRPTILFYCHKVQVVTLVGVKPSLDKMTIDLDACCLCVGELCGVLLGSLCQWGACSGSSEVKYRGTESQPPSTRLGLKTASQPSAKHK